MASVSAKKNTKAKVKAPEVHTFQWKGVNKQGQKTEGELQGTSSMEIRAMLRSQGIITKGIKRKPKALKIGSEPKITAMDMAMMTRQISTMLTAGVPLITTIELIAKGHDKAKMRQLLAEVIAEIKSGSPFSEAIAKHPNHFDALYVDLVAAGEHAGALEQVFDRIATYKEKAEALKSKIKKAMFYPAAVVVVAIGVTVLLLLKVVPQFEEIFKGFGAELPAFTQLLIDLSRGLQETWYFILGGLILIIVSYLQTYKRSPDFRDKIDEILLKVKIVGPILEKAAIARFARTLATTFSAGVPLIDGLSSAAGASGNARFRKGLIKIRSDVMTGMQLNVAMRSSGLFPDMLEQMVMIGEESGSLDEMLNKVANIYEMQVDDAVDALSSLIEPIMMVVIGSIVGSLIIGMYLPIFDMGNVVG